MHVVSFHKHQILEKRHPRNSTSYITRSLTELISKSNPSAIMFLRKTFVAVVFASITGLASSACVHLESIWGVGDGSKLYEDNGAYTDSISTFLTTLEGIGERELWTSDLQLDNHKGDIIGTSSGICTLLTMPGDPAAKMQCVAQFSFPGQGTITIQGDTPYNLDDAGWPAPLAITGGTGCFGNIIGGTIHIHGGNHTVEFDHFTYTLESLTEEEEKEEEEGAHRNLRRE